MYLGMDGTGAGIGGSAHDLRRRTGGPFSGVANADAQGVRSKHSTTVSAPKFNEPLRVRGRPSSSTRSGGWRSTASYRPIEVLAIANTDVLQLRPASVKALELSVKRAIDIVIASISLIVLVPLLALVAIAIRLDSPGPVIFRQTRHGLNGKPFQILKFRTMTVLEDGDSVKQAARFDKRVTRVGLWLRRSSIDELPQLINVLRGEMSIVGPRPHAAAHDYYYDRVIPNYGLRQRMKPGITGHAQVKGFRGETPTVEAMQRRVELDLWYIGNWSVYLDFAIMARTVIEVCRGHNAY
jgi:exopolysaccharide biosynthesis polyprenyl glycosylphosphotransferase